MNPAAGQGGSRMYVSDGVALGLLRVFVVISVVALAFIASARARRSWTRRETLRLTWEYQDLMAACI
ncbi:MAG TPA: hypothetical protein VFC86_12760, partial [Planctomycetota bacterium]|nr:hypothetical protein [Planctomycetota bacterium]